MKRKNAIHQLNQIYTTFFLLAFTPPSPKSNRTSNPGPKQCRIRNSCHRRAGSLAPSEPSKIQRTHPQGSHSWLLPLSQQKPIFRQRPIHFACPLRRWTSAPGTWNGTCTWSPHGAAPACVRRSTPKITTIEQGSKIRIEKEKKVRLKKNLGFFCS